MKLSFRVTDITAKIEENRQTHALDYETAMQGYREAVAEGVKTLNAATAEFVAGHGPEEPYQKALTALRMLPKPQDFLAEYDRALEMLDLSSAEEITLDEHDYRRYMRDEWEWKNTFLATSSTYLA